MVAVIKASGSLNNVLNYNEQKVKQKVAELIHSSNFLKEPARLTFTDKVGTFEMNNKLNQATKLKTIHISLNFDPSEKLDKFTLSDIADSYMKQIGFEEQPYLVYQHFDAGHPHLHIVSTNIKRDGSRIQMFNIGRNQSEKARRIIEQEFRLVRAEKNNLKKEQSIRAINVGKIQYGKSETKRAISNVLNAVLPTYKYCSLPELNAILKQYNLVADSGAKDSRTFKNGGLVYRILNEKGEKVGAPIKASAIFGNPGLKFLNECFKNNETHKLPYKHRVRSVIDYSFAKLSAPSLEALSAALKRENIDLVMRQNENGVLYGITYVDHKNKCVFNGSDLGKAYSANAVSERFLSKQQKVQPFIEKPEMTSTRKINDPAREFSGTNNSNSLAESTRPVLFSELTKIDKNENLAIELRQDPQKKRKRKRIRP